MIENINEIKYPVIIKAWEASHYLYESCKSAHKLDSEGSLYKESLPINKQDRICTKEFLQGKYVRVKCAEEFSFVKELALNGGFSFKCVYENNNVGCHLTFYKGFVGNHNFSPIIGKELTLPFPESIYQKSTSVEAEILTTEALQEGVEQEISTNEGDSLAESLHSLSERYMLFYSFYPSEEDSSSKSYFLVDYKEVNYKVDSVAKVGDLEKMIMIERGLCYEE